MTVLAAPAPSGTPPAPTDAVLAFSGIIFATSCWNPLLTVEGRPGGWAAPRLAGQRKVPQARIIYILLRSGPGCESAVTQMVFGPHVGDRGKMSKAVGSAEAERLKSTDSGATLWVYNPSPPLACLSS